MREAAAAKMEAVSQNRAHREAFYVLAAEYLPGSDVQKMRRFEKLYPEAFLVMLLEEKVIGAAFGWPRRWADPEDESFTLDGIAVRVEYQNKGFGKQLLTAFESAAARYGAPCVSVGSAGGYVERFYIENGYVPKQYKVWDDEGPVVEKVFESMEDYASYVRKDEDGFVVMEKRI